MPHRTTLIEADFTFAEPILGAAYEAIQDDASLEDGADVDRMLAMLMASDLTDVLDAHGFHYVITADGGVRLIGHEGAPGSTTRALLSTLAPFVTDGSHVDWLAEDGRLFRWLVVGDMLVVKHGLVQWVDPAEMPATGEERRFEELDETEVAMLVLRPFQGLSASARTRFTVTDIQYGTRIPPETFADEHTLRIRDMFTADTYEAVATYIGDRLYISALREASN